MNEQPVTTRIARACCSRSLGFSLAEVLIALAIFAIGFTAVASIFPVAIVLQKKATQDTVVGIGTDNAKSLLRGRKLRHDDPGNALLSLHQVMLGHTKVQVLNRQLIEEWSRGIRSYPKSITDYDQRDVYWEIVVRRTEPIASTTSIDWEVFVFVMVQEPDLNYKKIGGAEIEWAVDPTAPNEAWLFGIRDHPNVAGVPLDGISGNRFSFNNRRWTSETPAGEPDQVRHGDSVLDSNGNIYEVVEADASGVEVDGFIMSSPVAPDRIWYGVPAEAGKSNPVRRILVLNNVVSPT